MHDICVMRGCHQDCVTPMALADRLGNDVVLLAIQTRAKSEEIKSLQLRREEYLEMIHPTRITFDEDAPQVDGPEQDSGDEIAVPFTHISLAHSHSASSRNMNQHFEKQLSPEELTLTSRDKEIPTPAPKSNSLELSHRRMTAALEAGEELLARKNFKRRVNCSNHFQSAHLQSPPLQSPSCKDGVREQLHNTSHNMRSEKSGSEADASLQREKSFATREKGAFKERSNECLSQNVILMDQSVLTQVLGSNGKSKEAVGGGPNYVHETPMLSAPAPVLMVEDNDGNTPSGSSSCQLFSFTWAIGSYDNLSTNMLNLNARSIEQNKVPPNMQAKCKYRSSRDRPLGKLFVPEYDGTGMDEEQIAPNECSVQ